MFRILDKTETLNRVHQRLQNALSDQLFIEIQIEPDAVIQFIKDNCEKSDEENERITKGWMDFCKQSPHVRCVEAEVLPDVLPEGYSGKLIDVKVQGKKWAPDDQVYDSHDDVRDRIARGNCMLRLTHREMEIPPEWVFLIFGMKKFTGGWGDEDDDFPTRDVNSWQKYFIQPKESADQIVCMRKINGEAAHLSARQIGGKLVICAGSKNVHLLFRCKEDIDNYTDNRYSVAKTVAYGIWTMLTKHMMQDDACLLLNLLDITHMTANMEMLQPNYQHIENLEHLSEPQLNFLVWTRPYEEFTTSFCAIPPHLGLRLAEVMGIKPAEYHIITDSLNIEELFKKVHRTYNEEGRVLYFLDSKLKTIGLVKKKSAWYICLRALREKIVAAFARRRKGESSNTIRTIVGKKIVKRMEEIKEWLDLSEEYINSWKELGEAFLVWSFDVPQEESDNKIRGQFPVLWKRFLEESKRTDNIKFEQ